MVGDVTSMLSTGVTRDGLWLIENGKITKPVHNFRFTESPLFVLNNLNNVEQFGAPERVFHAPASLNETFLGVPTFPQPVSVPALKVREFSFTSLSDAI